MRIEHIIIIPNSRDAIKALLEHLRYSINIELINWEEYSKYNVNNRAIYFFKVHLIYKGTRAEWLSNIKPYAESRGLTVKEV